MNAIVPQRATQAQTEFAIELIGTGFLDAAEELTCKLTSNDTAKVVYQASLVAYEASTVFHCIFNVVPRGNYVLSVSMNAEQYVDVEVLFSVLPAIQILDVEPGSIMSRQEGQMVMVQAENLVDGCWCVFEHLSASLAPVIG